jgi:tetratricopeptide (TPR) repeat protein
MSCNRCLIYAFIFQSAAGYEKPLEYNFDMIRSFLLLSFLLLSTTMAFSESDTGKDGIYDDKLTVAINAFYDSDWATAEEHLVHLKKLDKDNPSVHFFYSMIPFWNYFFGGNNSEDAQEFLERSEQAIKVSDKRLRTASRDTSSVLLLSGLHGYRSLVAANEREYRIAVRSGMTGFSFTRQLMAMNTDNPNALLGRGIFNYMMGSIPREIRWATSFAGISGDRDEGIELLEKAANSDSFVSLDALMILAYLYLNDEEAEKAFRQTSKLVELRPDNIIFQFYHGKTAFETGRKMIATESFRNVLNSEHTHLSHLRDEAKKRLNELASLY